MQINDPEFFKQILSMFKMESNEHLETIVNGMEKLKSGAAGEERKEIVETVFRAAHSLKGAARTVGISELEEVGQDFERIFSLLKQKDAAISADIFEIFDVAKEQLKNLIESVDEDGKVNADKSELTRLISQMQERIVQLNA